MTNEELQAHIEAISAAIRRGEVEYQASLEWKELKTGFSYAVRIKPKPREVWIRTAPHGFDCTEVKEAFDKSSIPWAKFREVIE